MSSTFLSLRTLEDFQKCILEKFRDNHSQKAEIQCHNKRPFQKSNSNPSFSKTLTDDSIFEMTRTDMEGNYV